jgi:RimJ/RimL family protein N-acetyltransferase
VATYDGPPLAASDVSIEGVDPAEICIAAQAEDIEPNVNAWSRRAPADDQMVYFGVKYRGSLAGQIFLHDINRQRNESLVGYHLFARRRGQGIGTKALRLLQEYVSEKTQLRRLVVITGNDNVASLRMCRTCGFHEIGPSWEDPEHTMGLEWIVPRSELVAPGLDSSPAGSE